MGWTDPRPAKCQILYLRMKMLRLLQSGSGATPGFSDNSKGMHSQGMHSSGIGGGSDFDDPAFKRPKVGASGRAAGDDGHRGGLHGSTEPSAAANDMATGDRISPDSQSE